MCESESQSGFWHPGSQCDPKSSTKISTERLNMPVILQSIVEVHLIDPPSPKYAIQVKRYLNSGKPAKKPLDASSHSRSGIGTKRSLFETIEKFRT